MKTIRFVIAIFSLLCLGLIGLLFLFLIFKMESGDDGTAMFLAAIWGFLYQGILILGVLSLIMDLLSGSIYLSKLTWAVLGYYLLCYFLMDLSDSMISNGTIFIATIISIYTVICEIRTYLRN